VALARKLAGVLWAMWRDGTFYDPKGHTEQSEQGVRASIRQQVGRAQALQRAAKKLRRLAPDSSTQPTQSSQKGVL
jgi:hypothetical protein